MKEQERWTGKNLREMFRTGTHLLQNNAAAVNALNVFPVPDGDTGTNMLLTMQAALGEANLCPDTDASAVARAMARGALMGARGNSGVILSQILRGLAQGLEGKKTFTPSDMAEALRQASIMADRAVSHPVEGTILTVIREASSAGQAAVRTETARLEPVLETVVEQARRSVAKTPHLLPVLREAGVVDAGGQGLCFILEGLLYCLQGKEVPVEAAPPTEARGAAGLARMQGEETYGYCTEFLLRGRDLDLEEIRGRLSQMGEHVLVVGDPETAKVHIHTFDPGAVLSYAVSRGTLHNIKIDNMEEQHQEFIAGHAENPPLRIEGRIATIAVVTGRGLTEVFESLGTTRIVPGGETMNPSVKDLLEAVESVSAEEVILVPNNADIFPTARQVCELTRKKVAVVPSRTVMQGVSALVAFNFEADLETNVKAMTEALSGVRTGQVATAMRSMQHKGLTVREGQMIGFVDGELVVAEDTVAAALHQTLEKMGIAEAEILTAYFGENVDRVEAEALFKSVRSRYPHLEVEVIHGGQPHYHYLLSVE